MRKGRSRRANRILLLQSRPVSETAAPAARPSPAQLLLQRGRASLREKPVRFLGSRMTVTEVIHGTVYTVTGSYEGTESFVRKLERITSKKFAEKMEDSE